MRELALSQDKVALVDDEDYERCNKFKWSYAKGYATRSYYTSDGKRHTMKLHRFILGVEGTSKPFVDHISLDTLDNRKQNLRLCSHSENLCNKRETRRNKLGYKGISLTKIGRYKVTIGKNRKAHYLGTYYTLNEAIEKYNSHVIELHGAFAVTHSIESKLDQLNK